MIFYSSSLTSLFPSLSYPSIYRTPKSNVSNRAITLMHMRGAHIHMCSTMALCNKVKWVTYKPFVSSCVFQEFPYHCLPMAEKLWISLVELKAVVVVVQPDNYIYSYLSRHLYPHMYMLHTWIILCACTHIHITFHNYKFKTAVKLVKKIGYED